MNHSRLNQLLEFYKEDPNDPFNIYALATEYKSIDPEKALTYFELLIENHPDYVATYYHLAHLYLELEKDEEAKITFENGIEKATINNEDLMLRELKSAYDEFMMDY
ncbi:MAG: tetratricopeptide repeat protein [Cyclobacteriaceae bacterium]|nr:tetratricopeptide repeat protein [Cyclobacteriaceae bacterium]